MTAIHFAQAVDHYGCQPQAEQGALHVSEVTSITILHTHLLLAL